MFKTLKKRLKDQRGLTLIELLAVIVILGIIAAIAVPSIGGIIQKSKYDAAKAEALQAISAAKLYKAENPDDDSITKADLNNFLEDTVSWTDFTITVNGNSFSFAGTATNKFSNTPAITGDVTTINGLKYNKTATTPTTPTTPTTD